MLKLNYTELGLHMEQIATRLEDLIAQRVRLAISLGESLHVEQVRATILLPACHTTLETLKSIIRQNQVMSMCFADAGWVEVTLQGTWISADITAHTGTFVARLGDRAEMVLYQLWQTNQAQVSFRA